MDNGHVKYFLDPRFRRFIDWLRDHEEPCRVAARLHREGADLRRVFGGLVVYIEGRSIVEERRKRRRADQKIVNKGVRDYGVSASVGAWLRDRNTLARSTNGFSRVRNTDALFYVHAYLEEQTGRQVTMPEMTVLIDGTLSALGRKAFVTDSVEISRELRRYRQRKENATIIRVIREDVSRSIER